MGVEVNKCITGNPNSTTLHLEISLGCGSAGLL